MTLWEKFRESERKFLERFALGRWFMRTGFYRETGEWGWGEFIFIMFILLAFIGLVISL